MEQPNNNINKSLQPLLFAIVLVVGILLGIRLSSKLGGSASLKADGQSGKINEFLNYVEMNYVDTISKYRLMDETMTAMVQRIANDQ